MLSSMVLGSRLIPTGALLDISSYSFFNLFWYAMIVVDHGGVAEYR